MKTNLQEIDFELNRLRALGVAGRNLRDLCISNMATRWGMFEDEVSEIFDRKQTAEVTA